MKIGRKYKPNDVYLRHFHKLVAGTKVAQSALNRQIKKMTGKMLEAAPKLKEKLNVDGLSSDVFDDIIGVIKERSKHLSD